MSSSSSFSCSRVSWLRRYPCLTWPALKDGVVIVGVGPFSNVLTSSQESALIGWTRPDGTYLPPDTPNVTEIAHNDSVSLGNNEISARPDFVGSGFPGA